MSHRIGVDSRWPARHRSLSPRARAAYGARLRDVGQQRDRNALSGRSLAKMAHARRRAVSHRCGPGRRQDADRSEGRPTSICCRCPDTSCMAPRALARSTCAKARKFKPLIRGRPAGAQAARRHGERAGHRRTGEGCRTRGGLVSRRSGLGLRALRDRLEQGVLADRPVVVALGDSDNRAAEHRPISPSSISRAKPSFIISTAPALPPRWARPAPPGSMEPSHVLRAMNVPADCLRGAVRFSLSRETTTDEIDRCACVCRISSRGLRAMSPERGAARPPHSSRSTELIP